MKIIFANPEHLELVAPLFDAYRVFYKQKSDLNTAKVFVRERMELGESIIFLALDSDGRSMGFTQLYPMFSSVSAKRIFILNDLYVDENHREKGVGEALLKAAKEFCKKKGHKGIGLQTAFDNPAQYLYERLGWEKDPDLQYFWTNND